MEQSAEHPALILSKRPEWGLIQLMLRHREMAIWALDNVTRADFDDEVCRKALDLILEQCTTSSPSWPQHLLELTTDTDIHRLISLLLAVPDETEERWLEKKALDFVKRIKVDRIKSEFDHVKRTIASLQQSGDQGSKDLLVQLKRLQSLKQAMQNPLAQIENP